MVGVTDYYKNVDELLKSKNIDRKYFDILYSIYLGKKIDLDKTYLTDTIMNELFSIYNNEPLIPYKFFDSPVGEVMLSVKYGIENENFYYINDVAKIVGVTRQAILKDVSKGIINAEKPGRDWVFKEKDINDYLIRKGREPLSKEKLLYCIENENIIDPGFEREEPYKVSVKESKSDEEKGLKK